MNAECVVCGKIIPLDIDEFTKIEEIEDYFFDECSDAAITFCHEIKLRLN